MSNSIMGVLIGVSNVFAVSAETLWENTGLMKPYISSFEVTPMGLFAGQLNPNYWEIPYNGIYFSNDEGDFWVKKGLEGMGVTDIKYADKLVYATTYYSTDSKKAGLYYTTDWGKNWQHIGPNQPAKTIGVIGGKILLGTYTKGLLISDDGGANWKTASLGQKEGVRVEKMFINEEIIIVKTLEPTVKFYNSKDGGTTWYENALWGSIRANDFLMDLGLLYVATDYFGIVVSEDFESIGRSIGEFYNQPVLSLCKMGINLYASVVTEVGENVEIYKSSSQGITWESTSIKERASSKKPIILKSVFGLSEEIFASIYDKGLLKKKVIFRKEKEPFLGNLWADQKPNDLLNKITSFFDHKYPLLGYTPYPEPKDAGTITVNFLGQEGSEPDIYYSSHNGYDFALPYGTEVLAPAAGLVSGYYCVPCGNTIYIDHPNGYRTVYMHLQKEGLKANSWEKNLPISEGDILGKIGMTGNTTGPHLHFQIYKPNYEGSTWEIMHPKGLSDPFGWKNDYKHDPWAFFEWSDVFGSHSGRYSKYLWKEDTTINEIKRAFNGNTLLMDLDNIVLQIPPKTYSLPLFFNIAHSIPPISEGFTGNYINNTALSITAYNSIGEIISKLEDFITISIKVSQESIQNIIHDTLAIYHQSSKTGLWEKLLTNFDLSTLTLSAQSNEISNFAVIGTVAAGVVPYTEITLSGTQEANWFTEYPLVTMDNGNVGKILYCLYGEFWEEYSGPFYLEDEGIVRIRYRSLSDAGTLEPHRVMWVRIDLHNRIRKTLFMNSAQITTL